MLFDCDEQTQSVSPIWGIPKPSSPEILALLECHQPRNSPRYERSRSLSCPRARASKIKTILELEADRRRNHPDGARRISVSRTGSSIVGNGGIGGIGGRNPRHRASPLGI